MEHVAVLSVQGPGVLQHKREIRYMCIYLTLKTIICLIPDFGKKVKSITLFNSGAKIKFKQDAFGISNIGTGRNSG